MSLDDGQQPMDAEHWSDKVFHTLQHRYDVSRDNVRDLGDWESAHEQGYTPEEYAHYYIRSHVNLNQFMNVRPRRHNGPVQQYEGRPGGY